MILYILPDSNAHVHYYSAFTGSMKGIAFSGSATTFHGTVRFLGWSSFRAANSCQLKPQFRCTTHYTNPSYCRFPMVRTSLMRLCVISYDYFRGRVPSQIHGVGIKRGLPLPSFFPLHLFLNQSRELLYQLPLLCDHCLLVT